MFHELCPPTAPEEETHPEVLLLTLFFSYTGSHTFSEVEALKSGVEVHAYLIAVPCQIGKSTRSSPDFLFYVHVAFHVIVMCNKFMHNVFWAKQMFLLLDAGL